VSTNGRRIVIGIAALAAFAFQSTSWADEAPDVVAPHAVVAGKTIGEWTAEWWRAAVGAVDFPFPANGDGPGALGDVGGPVFFAVASPGPGATTYTYEVPRGEYVLLPLYTYAWLSQHRTDPCSTFLCARALADRFTRVATPLSVRVDGASVRWLFAHYEATPRTFFATAPVDGWWAGGDPTFAGLWFGAASGYWLMLEPLRPGTHVLSIAVKAPYTSVCPRGATSCDIPLPGRPELATTRLVLNVP